MSILRLIVAKVRALFRRNVVAGEIRDEMQFHVEMRSQEYERDGLPPDDARRRAKARFGNIAVMQDRGYDVRGAGLLETVAQDLRYGARLLMKDRAFSLVAIVTLALAMGAATALFSVIDAALLRPLPYPHPEQLVDVTTRTRRPSGEMYGAMAPSFNDLRDWRASATVFTHLGQARVADDDLIVDAGEPERLTIGSISEDFLKVFGITPLLGRDISKDDTRRGAPAVVLLGHAYWHDRFASDRNVVGRVIRVNGGAVTVVGVLPAGFYRGTAVWRPMVEVSADMANIRGSGTPTYGRLRDGVTLERGVRELTALSHGIALAAGRRTNFDVQLRSLYEETVGEQRPAIRALTGAVALVLLIACINVSGLLIARGAVRQLEFAIRTSMGAGRARLIRQLLTESLLLATAGGISGAVLAWLLLDALTAILPLSLPPNAPPAMNLQVLAFAAALSFVVSIFFGLVPAFRLSHLQPAGQLTRTAWGRTAVLSRRGGQLLIAAEVALALVLLTGAGLMLRSLARALSIDVGFDPDSFVTMEVFPVDPAPAVQAQYFPALLQTVRAIPGVTAAGAIDFAPLSRGSAYTGATGNGEDIFVAFKRVLPGYFEAIGLSALQGRLPSDADSSDRLTAAVLSETAARQLFPDGPAIGRQITMTDKTSWNVIGVVRDIRSRSAFMVDRPDVYLPLRLDADKSGFLLVPTIVVRPAGPLTGLAERLRHAALAVGPRVIVERVRSGGDWFSENMIEPRRQTFLLGLLGGLGLTLTLVGVFGVTAYAVARRTQEIGVRMAFGARPGQVVAAIVRDAMWPMVFGVVVGLAGAYYATAVIKSFLFETTPHDPATFVAMAAFMVATAFLAAWIPARRAARVDPVVALRAE